MVIGMDNTNPLVSVIVPIYGVEAYLDECVKSIVEQTYENLEIILVDDGSNDRCPEMIDQWASRDSRIVPVHKKNGGQSSARNVGLDIAKGDFVAFIDGDDWVEKNYFESLLYACLRYKADIAVGGFQRVKEDKKYPEHVILEDDGPYYPATVDHAAKYFIECTIALWGKVYRKDVLTELRLPVGRLAEEYAFQLRTLQIAKRVCFCSLPLYNYRIRADSDAHSIKPSYLLDNILAIDEAVDICQQHFAFEVDFCKHRLSSLLYEYLSAKRFGQQETEKRPDVLAHALDTVGGKEALLEEIETPLETIFYTYRQFESFMSVEEKRKIQRDYRKVFSMKHILNQPKKYLTKYIPAYISIPLMVSASRLVR